jgi:hypothetical protein
VLSRKERRAGDKSEQGSQAADGETVFVPQMGAVRMRDQVSRSERKFSGPGSAL